MLECKESTDVFCEVQSLAVARVRLYDSIAGVKYGVIVLIESMIFIMLVLA